MGTSITGLTCVFSPRVHAQGTQRLCVYEIIATEWTQPDVMLVCVPGACNHLPVSEFRLCRKLTATGCAGDKFVRYDRKFCADI